MRIVFLVTVNTLTKALLHDAVSVLCRGKYRFMTSPGPAAGLALPAIPQVIIMPPLQGWQARA